MTAVLLGILVAAAIAGVAIGIYLGQNRRSARGHATRVVRDAPEVEHPPTQDRSAREQAPQ